MMSQEEEEEGLPLKSMMINIQDNIAGVDEVGRGCLFGPVFASAVVLNNFGEQNLIKSGLKDSKAISSKKRSKLVPVIKKECIDFGIGQSSAREIDYLGIRKATEIAMIRAIHKLSKKPKIIFVDGILPLRIWKGEQKTIIKGDEKFPSIAAASILAKEERDSLLKRLAKIFPMYLLEKNVGYGTNFHRKAIRTFGVSKLHRKTFLSKVVVKDFL